MIQLCLWAHQHSKSTVIKYNRLLSKVISISRKSCFDQLATASSCTPSQRQKILFALFDYYTSNQYSPSPPHFAWSCHTCWSHLNLIITTMEDKKYLCIVWLLYFKSNVPPYPVHFVWSHHTCWSHLNFFPIRNRWTSLLDLSLISVDIPIKPLHRTKA